jgi:hypothetical protein
MPEITTPADYHIYLDGLLQHFSRTHFSLDSAEVRFGIERLEALARGVSLDPKVKKEILESPWFQKAIAFTRNYYAAWEVGMEQSTAKLFKRELGSDLSKLRSLGWGGLERTFLFAREECNAMGVHPHAHVAFVGSGPLPESAMAITLQFGCAVTCVDCDEHALSTSQALIEESDLRERFSFLHMAGEKVDFSEFSHVWVAVMASNKPTIIRRVFETNPAALISCRTAADLKSLLYEPLDESQCDGLVRKEIRSSNPDTIIHSLVLRQG